MIWRLAQGEWAGELLHGSGEFAARLLIVALAISPLRVIAPHARWLRTLRRYRRDIGVAAFAYGALHTVFYLIDMETLRNVLAEIGALGIWTGWLAFAVFIPLAITSNDFAVRALGQNWQNLHRLVYLAAFLTLIHWIYVHNNFVAAWVHFVPLIGLEIYRGYKISKTFFAG